jgi:hypothetical protein
MHLERNVMSRSATWLGFVALSFVATWSGCGGETPAKSLPKTVEVAGLLRMDGKPLTSALVTFVPSGSTKGVECTGLTDDAGKFSLTQLRGGSGAPPGEYRVVVNRFVKGDGKPVALGMGEFPADVGAVESLPPRYSSMESTLTATVPPMGGAISLDLKSK